MISFWISRNPWEGGGIPKYEVTKEWREHNWSPCIVEPVAALVADSSVKSTGSYIQYSTSPSSYNKRETSHSKTLSNLLEWHMLQLERKWSTVSLKYFNIVLESLTESTYSLVLYTIPVKERCRWPMESKNRRTEHHPHEFPNWKSFKDKKYRMNNRSHSHRLHRDGPK